MPATLAEAVRLACAKRGSEASGPATGAATSFSFHGLAGATVRKLGFNFCDQNQVLCKRLV